VQAVFNQDNGTGRVVDISGQGFKDSYAYIGRWLDAAPKKVKDQIKTNFPECLAVAVLTMHRLWQLAFQDFRSLNWGYFGYWHTTKDTYDKIVFDELKNNVILTATLAYMASEDPEFVSREKRVMPMMIKVL
jgi:hypothetical protein